jgi:hypothetical protein
MLFDYRMASEDVIYSEASRRDLHMCVEPDTRIQIWDALTGHRFSRRLNPCRVFLEHAKVCGARRDPSGACCKVEESAKEFSRDWPCPFGTHRPLRWPSSDRGLAPSKGTAMALIPSSRMLDTLASVESGGLQHSPVNSCPSGAVRTTELFQAAGNREHEA